jgi:HlyD family secretion protein
MEPARVAETDAPTAEGSSRPAGPAPVALLSRRRRRVPVWVWVVLLFAAAGAGGWFWTRDRKKKPRVFSTVKVDRGAVEDGITATGTLQAVETVDVGALVSGRVMKLTVDENQEVKAGMVIAEIDPEPYQARVEQGRAALEAASAALERAAVERRRAEREATRIGALGDSGALGAAEVDTAQSGVELARAVERSARAEITRARASLRAAQLDVDRTTIVSPIDGLVLARKVEVGQAVTAGFQTPTLFTIARDLAEMEVRAAIDEADVGKVHEGQEARFSVGAFPGEDFKGRIAQIRRSPTVTQNVVTYEAVIRVENLDKRLWPGMTATVRVVTAHKDDVLRVPSATLRFKPPKDMQAAAAKQKPAPPGAAAPGSSKNGVRKVWKLVNGQPVAVDLRLGVSGEDYAEVESGELAVGDDLITEIPGDSGGPKPQAPSGGGGRPRGRMF